VPGGSLSRAGGAAAAGEGAGLVSEDEGIEQSQSHLLLVAGELLDLAEALESRRLCSGTATPPGCR